MSVKFPCEYLLLLYMTAGGLCFVSVNLVLYV